MRAALEAGADVDARVDGEHTAFKWMVESGCVEGLEELVKWGSTGAREPAPRNMHSLVQAAKSGNERVLECILDCGADIDAVDPWGGYAVQAAAIGVRHDCLAVLLVRGAKTDHKKRGDGQAVNPMC